MYSRVLVPLEGSRIDDRVLPHVEALAGQFGGTVFLLRVTTSTESLLAQESGALSGGEIPATNTAEVVEVVEAEAEGATRYLEAQDESLRRRGIPSEVIQVDGEPADEIVRAAETIPADLIVMGTHGRSGLGRLILGSVADSVVRRAPCPVLLIRAKDD